jgi:general secretion pathway protein D
MRRSLPYVAALVALASCATKTPPLTPLPPLAADTGVAAPRLNGTVTDAISLQPEPELAEGNHRDISAGRVSTIAAGPDVTLDFADTDIREIVKQVLGGILKVNFTIDPAVRGTATVQTPKPIPRSELLPTLEALLSQNGATLIETGNLYRVMPSASALAAPSLGQGTTAGTDVIGLHYASAKDLDKILEPYVGDGARIQADIARNALIVSGEPDARATVRNLIHAFDIDVLAGQSYALFPVSSGDPAKVAEELQKVFQTEGDGALNGVVRVIPMERVNAVLIVSPQPRYLDEARRLFHLVDLAQTETARSWHVYYVQNGQSGDIANLLQRAFTPDHVTAKAESTGSTAPGQGQSEFNNSSGGGSTGGSSGGLGSSGGSGTSGGLGSGGGLGSSGGLGSGSGSSGAGGGLGQSRQTEGAAAGDESSSPATESLSEGSDSGAGSGSQTNTIRIIQNRTNNAILIFATPSEESTIEAMLRKVDILPLQVRIDATIAEVTLNDSLQYGTQFSFKGHGIEGLLTNAATSGTSTSGLNNALTGIAPGFNIARIGGSGDAQAVLSALASVSDVRVLSAPQVMVLDNQPARLLVGNLVPYLTQSAQSTLTANTDVINSVDYRETGVILDVIPRVNSGGLVSLDISQEVSGVASESTGSLGSPTFSERKIRTKVVVQNGETVGLAGLITDTTSRENDGIPYLKDIPILGTLLSNQNNTRTRTELVVLITPHVMQDQRDARSLTEDLRENLLPAGLVPQQLKSLPPSGSSNPNAVLSQ